VPFEHQHGKSKDKSGSLRDDNQNGNNNCNCSGNNGTVMCFPKKENPGWPGLFLLLSILFSKSGK
jgi:hypothetical protein